MIDYIKIAESVKFYESIGFEYIDVPWAVDLNWINVTIPEHRKAFKLDDKYLIGSGEQALIELVASGLSGRYCCVTPCFRDEQIIDNLHKKFFMKTELIDTDASVENLHSIMNDCKEFFNRYVNNVSIIPVEPNSFGKLEEQATYDIVCNLGVDIIELGSYGIRTHSDVGSWIFATGCAEPRLSTVKGYENG